MQLSSRNPTTQSFSEPRNQIGKILELIWGYSRFWPPKQAFRWIFIYVFTELHPFQYVPIDSFCSLNDSGSSQVKGQLTWEDIERWEIHHVLSILWRQIYIHKKNAVGWPKSQNTFNEIGFVPIYDDVVQLTRLDYVLNSAIKRSHLRPLKATEKTTTLSLNVSLNFFKSFDRK
jgi:hypothetical protein